MAEEELKKSLKNENVIHILYIIRKNYQFCYELNKICPCMEIGDHTAFETPPPPSLPELWGKKAKSGLVNGFNQFNTRLQF